MSLRILKANEKDCNLPLFVRPTLSSAAMTSRTEAAALVEALASALVEALAASND